MYSHREQIAWLKGLRAGPTREEDVGMVSAIVVDMDAMMRALRRAERLFDEALPKFNWGASALDANAITLLNEVPGEVRHAIATAHAS